MQIGIVAGSFDPITFGHFWLIKKSIGLLGPEGKLYVVMGVNPSKKYYFSAETREQQIKKVMQKYLDEEDFNRVEVVHLQNDLLINFASEVEANYIFRGIRNAEDFNYESQIQQINRDICEDVETVFFIPPPELTSVSSSIVKGLVGFNDWQKIVYKYVDEIIIEDFNTKLAQGQFNNARRC